MTDDLEKRAWLFGTSSEREDIPTLPTVIRGPVKLCRCCFASYTLSEWEDLHEVGTQPDGDGYVLVLRNCPCGSTLAIRTEAIQ